MTLGQAGTTCALARLYSNLGMWNAVERRSEAHNIGVQFCCAAQRGIPMC